MADIDQILAGGAGATSRADFSGIADIPEAYWKGKDRRFTQEGRDLFKTGVPMILDANGNPTKEPDLGAMSQMLFQHGDVGQGVAINNLDLARQKLRFGQQLGERIWPTSGDATGQPPAQSLPPLPPSSNRQAPATVAPPLNRGGVQQQPQAGGASSGGGGASIYQILNAQGIPNDQLASAGASIARQIGVDDPAQPLDTSDPRIRNVLVPAIAQLKRAGVGNIIPEGQPSPPDQVVGQSRPQVMGPAGAAQPNAQGVYPANAVMMPQQPPVVAQGAPPPPPPTIPQGQPPQAIRPVPASQTPTDPTLGGLVPAGRTPEQQLTLLRRAVMTGMLDPNAEKLAQEQIKTLEGRLAPTDPEKAFDAARRNPALDPYVAKVEADKAAAKAIAEGNVKEQQGFIDAGRSAGQRLTTLNTVANIIQNDKSMTLGFGADTALKVKKALQQIGFDVGDLSGAQSIEKLNGLLAAEATKTISPRPSQFEFKTFLANNPGLNMDRAGNMRVISIFSQLAKRDLDLGKLARQNRGDWQNWDNVVEGYDKNHPIVDPVTRQPISTNTVIAPGPAKSQTAPVASPPVPNAKQAPDGNWYLPDPNRPGKYLRVSEGDGPSVDMSASGKKRDQFTDRFRAVFAPNRNDPVFPTQEQEAERRAREEAMARGLLDLGARR